MPRKPLIELIDYRYGDRGGWRGVEEICRGPLSYEDKAAEIQRQYRVSTVTGKRWIALFKELEAK